MNSYTRPAYSVISAATEGDPIAIQAILRHYRGYIFRLATYTAHDEYGNAYTTMDMEVIDQLEDALIAGILTFQIE